MIDYMRETMDEIERLDAQVPKANKESLSSDILKLEKSIKTAQKAINQLNQEPYGYAPVSPEQANRSHREVVFLKKDLANKKSAYEELGR